MCTVCGCGHDQPRVEGADAAHGHAEHEHAGHVHAPAHDHTHDHTHDHGVLRAHAPGIEPARMVQIERDILSKNDAFAAANRAWFAARAILALNLVSSPGSGKTTLLARTASELRGSMPIAVLEGDQETSLDAERIRATGVPALQINTGKGCHLDAHMIGHALEVLAPEPGAVLFIENVGNLVCPAAFDLGEAAKVAILSVTEGDDKPLKYPDMFQAADLLVLNKIDLLPYVDFDVQACIAHARRVHPGIAVLPVSARSGEGLSDWYAWLRLQRDLRQIGRAALTT